MLAHSHAGNAVTKVVVDPEKPTQATFVFDDGANKTVNLGDLQAKVTERAGTAGAH